MPEINVEQDEAFPEPFPLDMRRGDESVLPYMIGGLILGLVILTYLFYEPSGPTYEYYCEDGYVLMNRPHGGGYACLPGYEALRREVK